MNLDRLEKINVEKRRRYQVYTTLDYLISGITYFDFFSLDAIEIVENAKYLAQICNKKNVTTEFLLLAFFYSDLELLQILREFKISERRIARFVMKNSKLKKSKKNFFNSIFEKFNNKKSQVSLDYSYEVNKIFEKASENALTRFKTPVINSAILFMTLLDEEKSLGSKMIRHILKKDVDWYLVRYKILKYLHNHESTIRSNVLLNQHYFAYLLKTQLTDKQFSSLIEQENLGESVSLFRNDLVSQILKINLSNKLKKDTKISMNFMNKRRYTI
jgi:hypothetical protein